EPGEHSRHPVARRMSLFNQSLRCVHLFLYSRNFALQISGVGARVLQLPGELQVHTVSVVFLEVGFIHYSEQALLDGQPPRSTLAASRRRKGCLQLVTLQFTARSSSTALSKKSDVRISKELALKRANTLVRCDSRG